MRVSFSTMAPTLVATTAAIAPPSRLMASDSLIRSTVPCRALNSSARRSRVGVAFVGYGEDCAHLACTDHFLEYLIVELRRTLGGKEKPAEAGLKKVGWLVRVSE
jgi:hypothetical protein